MRCTCALCDISFASISDYQKHICGMKTKMTREEAIKILDAAKWADSKRFIITLEKLGLLRFDEENGGVKVIFESNEFRFDLPNGFVSELNGKYGVIRLEEWPEGLVLWVGGEIKWKSWEPDRTKELVKKLAGEVKIKVHTYDTNVNTARGRIIE